MDKIQQINKLFEAFKIKASAVDIQEGLRTVKYFVLLEPGEKISKIKNIQQELALEIRSLTTPSITLKPDTGHLIIEATISNKPLHISLEDIFTKHKPKCELPLVLGKTMDGNVYEIDLASAPHLLIAGTTGSGKSVITSTIVKSLTHHLDSNDLKLIFIDPKQIELNKFKDSKFTMGHATQPKEALSFLKLLVELMNVRYQRMSNKNINSFKELRKQEAELHPYVVIVIDELADLLLQDSNDQIFSSLVCLLQKSRAAGIHIICNTQRPSRDIIKGLLKANLPVQIALKTTSSVDSRIILGTDGAESLVGRGDMLVNYNGQVTRVQAAM